MRTGRPKVQLFLSDAELSQLQSFARSRSLPAALITDKAIRRGFFTSAKQLMQRIDHFVAAYNANCQPFKWTATADSILEKLHRLCSRISGTGH